MCSLAARLPFFSLAGLLLRDFRAERREVERVERRRFRVPPNRRFDRFEPLRLRRGAPPTNEPNKRAAWFPSIVTSLH